MATIIEPQPRTTTARVPRAPWRDDVQPPTKTEGGPRLPYLPGLDGLRAIAVIAVFLYHAEVGWAPGGFLGVDVFFVLSGYLITSLLLAEREFAHGLRDFWIRRARRLLPAVLLVIATTLVITAIFLRGDLGRTRGDALSSVFYVTNWHLILGHHSYFAAFARPSLLQHLWSLAVEEQFYVIWPLALTAGLAMLGRRRFVPLVALVALLSTIEMAVLFKGAGTDPSRVYYGTDTRAAPLLIGALLAFAWSPRRLRPTIARGAGMVLDGVGAAALVGLVAIFVSVHDFDPALYRGGLTGIAVLAAVVLAVLAHPAGRLSRIVGSRGMRWIGVRSYGIYLWHWPVIALTRPGIDVPRGPITVILQAAVTVAQTNLNYTDIHSPIDGVVVNRTIDVGQTVAASLQAPNLFQIAQDLTKMQVYTSTDESDVGQIKVGQPVTFKVDAFPKDTFHGSVSQIRLNPTTV